MGRSLVSAVVMLFATTGLVRAQAVVLGPPLAPGDGPILVAEPLAPPPTSWTQAWFRADYLLWWMRSAPTGGPLIALGSPTDTVPGALDQPGTTPFPSQSRLTFGNTSGLRFSAGVPLGDAFSVEASYFYLEQRANGFTASATADDMVVVARPVTNAQMLTQAAYPTAFPGSLTGGSAVAAQARLQGYDLSVAANLYRDNALSFDVLGGFRSLYLDESLTVTDSLTPVVPGFITFLGAPVDALTPVSDFDRFRTHNTFYGGKLAGRLIWQEDGLTVSALGGAAVGVTQQLAIVNGATTVSPPGAAPVTSPGGILAQPSNIGRWYHTTFSVAPEVGVDVGYQVNRWLRVNVGYTLVYWTHVARPGNQIDHTVNPAQVPLDPTFGTGGGPNRPAPPSFQQSDFWAQGVSFGITLTY